MPKSWSSRGNYSWERVIESLSLCNNSPLFGHQFPPYNASASPQSKHKLLRGKERAIISNERSHTEKLDVNPQRDDDASPMSTYRCMLRPTWMISALQHKSKYKSNSISNFFEKKSNFLVLMLQYPWRPFR